MYGAHNYRHTLRHGWRWIWEDLRYRHAPVVALRTFWWAIVCGHDGEACQFCGQRYVLWHAPDALWLEIMGSAAGLSCPSCFDRRAGRRGVWLCWQPVLWEDYLAGVEAERAGGRGMSERTCLVCGRKPPEVRLFVAADDGAVVVSVDPGDDPHDGHRVRAGDLVCMSHVAVRPNGSYVRVEDGG